MSERDIEADLAICSGRTHGLWKHRTILDDGTPHSDVIYVEDDDDWGIITGEHLSPEDAAFIVLANEAGVPVQTASP
jgi:hypothetical protein